MNTVNQLQTGVVVDEPQLLIQWESSQEQIIEQLKQYPFRQVTRSYLCFEASIFDSAIRCMIGLHFSSSDTTSVLEKVELFRDDSPVTDEKLLIKSFSELQTVLEREFGNATIVRPSLYFVNDDENEVNDYCWIIGRVHIYHFLLDRFGFEEHVSISVGENSDEKYYSR